MPEIKVKNIIVESATIFFARFGFHKTTMDEIAKHTHKAKGVLYYYFKSKEELFNEVLKRELNSAKTHLSKIANSDADSLTMLNEYMLTRFKLLNNSENYHETLKADFFERYQFVRDVRDEFDAFERSQLTYILNKGKNEEHLDIKNVNSTLNVIMMVIHSIEIPLYLQNKYTEYEKPIDELTTLLIKSLKTLK
ncbi:MAG: TetR/AcrR family transcriptional regulator; helix-turn-helix transcriptional regulator [Bacteroidales bacterium]|nr:TetR/AcrR family transcriptional regulator; helix-turn-helix transcriptional regulator [Bacteroidales bacterium]